MKKLFLLALSLTICSLILSAQHDKFDPLVVINGKVSNIGLNSIDPKTIEEVTVLKDQAATDAYGEVGKNGIILVYTKDKVKHGTSKDQVSEALILVNGEVNSSGLTSINPNEINSITVLKGKAATDTYGEVGKNGVILVYTKDKVKHNTSKDQISEALILVNGEVYTSGLNSIDPNEIKSVTVLKDKPATDIYGKAGEKGVILITTTDNNK